MGHLNIRIGLRLWGRNVDEERRVGPETSVGNFVESYLSGRPEEIRRMLIDNHGVFRGVVLVNGKRAEMDKGLQDGDRLLLLTMMNA